jgi:hypothetical protein
MIRIGRGISFTCLLKLLIFQLIFHQAWPRWKYFLSLPILKRLNPKKGFDPKGIFSTHMVSIGYSLFFTRLDDIIEGVDENEYTYVKTKVRATTRKTTPKKKNKSTRDDAHTRKISNFRVKEVPL